MFSLQSEISEPLQVYVTWKEQAQNEKGPGCYKAPPHPNARTDTHTHRAMRGQFMCRLHTFAIPSSATTASEEPARCGLCWVQICESSLDQCWDFNIGVSGLGVGVRHGSTYLIRQNWALNIKSPLFPVCIKCMTFVLDLTCLVWWNSNQYCICKHWC